MKIRMLVMSGLFFLGCEGGPVDLGQGEEEEEQQTSQVNSAGQITSQDRAYEGTVLVSGQLSEGSSLLQAVDYTDLQFTWVTFDDEPQAGRVDLDSSGYFQDELPRNKQFGAFIRSKSEDAVLASLVMGGVEGDPDRGEQGTFALDKAIDLGSLSITDGKIVVAREVVEAAMTKIADSLLLNLDDIHDRNYEMSCIDTGDAAMAETCAEFLVNEDGEAETSVFFRVIKGEQDGKPIRAMGVWASSAAFEACGSVDMTQDMVDQLVSEGVTLSQISIGDFTVGEGCPERSDDQPQEDQNQEMSLTQDDDRVDPASQLEHYFALNKVDKVGGGWVLNTGDGGEETHSDGQGNEFRCHFEYRQEIVFGGDAAVMSGAFNMSETFGCDGEEPQVSSGIANIRFTQQP